MLPTHPRATARAKKKVAPPPPKQHNRPTQGPNRHKGKRARKTRQAKGRAISRPDRFFRPMADRTTNAKQALCSSYDMWSTLPVELRREIIIRWLSDRDVGACLLAGRSFCALTTHDLERRRYAYATVEGMCAVGDLRGLQYALARRPTTEPVDWAMCMHAAAIREHVDVIAWIVDRVGPAPGLDDGDWREVYALATGPEALLRPLATMRCVSAQLLQQKDPWRTVSAFERASNMWNHSTPEARSAALALCQHEPWLDMANQLMRYVLVLVGDHDDARVPVDAVVRANRDERRCRAQGHLREAERHAEKLVEGAIAAIWALVADGRLDDAVDVVSNPAALEGHHPSSASAAHVHVAEACALAGRRALVETMCRLIDRNADREYYVPRERVALVRGAARGGHLALLKYLLLRWPHVCSVAYDAAAHAVKNGHVDCVRWLCKHSFPISASVIWCPVRVAHVSALTLALTTRRDDMVNVLLGALDARDAIRLAFDSAVAAGDLRIARRIRALPLPAAPTGPTDTSGLAS
ncbi:hypothetical protein pneo_cds_815 [Pandoravirus neocaledonia]|uniref:Ankyrin repeat domain containing protein n=1 Tax=Pandoravirus neocaledonia TaxID=2107708 RepID=A0A2U7UDE0_9VIRU|nr:hypothetical protein pneo_cds_815 [Pandoravirus neocaledonia]AVK76422.1 hypothetical protein pneo_cds_815 [Pandoravirus neocaledonia]